MLHRAASNVSDKAKSCKPKVGGTYKGNIKTWHSIKAYLNVTVENWSMFWRWTDTVNFHLGQWYFFIRWISMYYFM